MLRALPLLLFCAAATAAEVAQFRAEDFGTEWRAARGGAALTAIHPATNGWAAAFADGGGVSFSATDGVASPLEFDPATTGAVARVLVVADCTEARPWSALLDAPVGAALVARAFDWDAVRFAESNGLGAVSVSVDGVPGATIPADTFVLTVFGDSELFGFAQWIVDYADLSWTADLPAPPSTKPNGETADWHAPGTPGSYMHHDAVFEMRSKPIAGGHGHQATFDGSGHLIANGTIACGTADYVSPESYWDGSLEDHRDEDVKPYLMALHLDGNPGHPDNASGCLTETVPSRLTNPCIYQGFYTRQYLRLRPSFPTGIQTP